MASFDWKTALICVLTLACGLMWWSDRDSIRAQGTANSNADMIAVTGTYGSGASVLYIIDTRAKQLAVYTSRNGRGVELVAARQIETDLQLMSYRDESPQSMRPMKLKENYRKYLTGQDATPLTDDADFGPATPIKPEKEKSVKPKKATEGS
ncbi:MAG: hypothetical protein V3W41_19955 [Planctomycetota bacterium]